MRDSVTAITIVALGTSLPDLFASMQAAREDPTADNSVGNVTGSNSVNVFLGLGLPFVMATIYWSARGATPEWIGHYPNLHANSYPDGARRARRSARCAHSAGASGHARAHTRVALARTRHTISPRLSSCGPQVGSSCVRVRSHSTSLSSLAPPS